MKPLAIERDDGELSIRDGAETFEVVSKQYTPGYPFTYELTRDEVEMLRARCETWLAENP